MLVLVYLYGQSFFIGPEVKSGLQYFKENFRDISGLSRDNVVDAGRWQKIVSETSISSVGIQSFKDNKIYKQGSGLILSSDGLIVTTYDNMPVNASGSQVFYGGKIYKPTILVRDYNRNLVLAKIVAEGLTVSRLDQSNSTQSGEELLIVGSVPFVSKPTIFSQIALLSYVTDREIVLDSTPNYYINGGKIVNGRSEVLGIVQIRSGKVTIVKSQDIDLLLKNYLNKGNH
ncbi:MAG: Trypsin [Parcubacteria group bacterium GW2011_GWC1_39_29]|nr:MAG: Trypsin [Parcubacteria group bacterium GW2011_GWC1_39_29]